jgi:cysteine sulfinate desulfinase/cysteine desulfurase-like protein
MIYLDNAATSWPKPDEVINAVCYALQKQAGNPGRSGHRLSREAEKVIQECRQLLAHTFNATTPDRFVFSSGATESINLAIKGTLKYGNHVIISSMEHNAVVRPINTLSQYGVEVSKVHMDENTRLR